MKTLTKISFSIPAFLFFSMNLHAHSPLIESSDFESGVVPRAGFQVQTAQCLVVQPTYDKLSAVFDAALDLRDSRLQDSQIRLTSQKQEQFKQSLDGFELSIRVEDENSPYESLILKVEESEAFIEFVHRDADKMDRVVSDPRALTLIEDFLNLVNRSRLDRYEGLLLESFQIGDLTTRHPSGFIPRVNRIPEIPSELKLSVELSKEDDSLSYDLSSNFYAWMYRLETSGSELPHRRAQEFCVRFQCDRRNVSFQRNDPVYRENQRLYGDWIRQAHRVMRDYSAISNDD